MSAWIVVIVAGFGSFLFRLSIVALIDRVETPPWLEALAAYVVPAGFAGMAAAALAGPLGGGGTQATGPAIAVTVTAALAARDHPVHIAFLGGLCSLWAVAALSTLT